MDLTLADQYYLKASSEYPYSLEFVIENLNYALSYDEEHTQSLCLLGKVYMFQMKEFHVAQTCFQKALLSDKNYPDTYKYLSLLKTWLADFDGALKILERGMKIKGMNRSNLLLLESLVHESKGDFGCAKSILKKAKLFSFDQHVISHIDCHIKRIKVKMKATKPKKSKNRARLAVV